MSRANDKRKKITLSAAESRILHWMFLKTLLPVVIIIAVSLTVLYLGLHFLISKVSFGNYGLAPQMALNNASGFISSYIIIAVSNILLMLSLCVIVLYRLLHDLVLPIMRITRETKRAIDSEVRSVVTVRKTDRLLIPLVDCINRLMQKL